MLRITTLMDNEPSENKALLHEHGLSYLLETEHVRLLFDCGAGAAVLHNAHRLGEDLTEIDAVVLSHSHYDHAAGYRDLIESGGGGKLLYTGPHFFEAKYGSNEIKYTDLSAGFQEKFLAAHGITRRICDEMTEIFPGIWLIGDFPRIYEFEKIPERFVKRTETGFVQDNFEDEICLAVETSKGLVVLVGCSHPGILNMIHTIYERQKKPIYAVFGGTHLKEADEKRVQETVRVLKSMGLSILGLGHCSGEHAECAVRQDPDVKSCHMAVGDCIFFD